MRIKTLIVTLSISFALIAYSNASLSQTATSYSKGRFLTKDGKKVVFYSLIFDGNVCKFQPKSNDSYQQVAAENIARIDKETGNRAVVWGVSMGAAGLIGGLLGQAEANSEYGSLNTESSSTKTTILVSTTAISALLGVLIGSAKKTYTTVYNNPNLNSGLKPNFNINLVFSNNVKGLGVRFAF
jgi:hypothetical protein